MEFSADQKCGLIWIIQILATYSKCDLWASSMEFAWELLRNAEAQTPPQTH